MLAMRVTNFGAGLPRHARGFFEALVSDNLDIGRPELIELVFKRGQPRGRKAKWDSKTKIVSYGAEVSVNAFYKHSRIKQYLNCDARSHAMSGYADWRVSRC
jgi:hypothetical protein